MKTPITSMTLAGAVSSAIAGPSARIVPVTRDPRHPAGVYVACLRSQPDKAAGGTPPHGGQVAKRQSSSRYIRQVPACPASRARAGKRRRNVASRAATPPDCRRCCCGVSTSPPTRPGGVGFLTSSKGRTQSQALPEVSSPSCPSDLPGAARFGLRDRGRAPPHHHIIGPRHAHVIRTAGQHSTRRRTRLHLDLPARTGSIRLRVREGSSPGFLHAHSPSGFARTIRPFARPGRHATTGATPPTHPGQSHAEGCPICTPLGCAIDPQRHPAHSTAKRSGVRAPLKPPTSSPASRALCKGCHPPAVG